MFELISKAKVIWSMLTGRELSVVRPATGIAYTVKYIPKHKEFEVREKGNIVLRVKISE